MEKIDFKKELKHLYRPSSKKIEMVDVPAMNFLMVEGQGDPNTSPEFQNAIETLFSVAYTLKFLIKKGDMAIDYGVLPLEGLWWTEEMKDFSVEKKAAWKWTMMIQQPEFVTAEHILTAKGQVEKKKNPPALGKLQFKSYHEGKSAQILYIGPFADEGPTIEMIHDFIHDNGYELTGRHHEIYLSDFRRTAPAKLRTIIRQPMKKVTKLTSDRTTI